MIHFVKILANKNTSIILSGISVVEIPYLDR